MVPRRVAQTFDLPWERGPFIDGCAGSGHVAQADLRVTQSGSPCQCVALELAARLHTGGTAATGRGSLDLAAMAECLSRGQQRHQLLRQLTGVDGLTSLPEACTVFGEVRALSPDVLLVDDGGADPLVATARWERGATGTPANVVDSLTSWSAPRGLSTGILTGCDHSVAVVYIPAAEQPPASRRHWPGLVVVDFLGADRFPAGDCRGPSASGRACCFSAPCQRSLADELGRYLRYQFLERRRRGEPALFREVEFTIVTPPQGPDGGGLLLSSHEEQLDVLAAILAVTDADLAEEETDDKDDIANLGKKSATRRVVGDMAALSGAAGMRYMEYSTGAGGGQGGRARPPGGGKLAKMAKKYG